MQTAVGVFGGEGYTGRMDVLPMMVANAGSSGRSAISSLNCPPIMAVELCREHLAFLKPPTTEVESHIPNLCKGD
ncbi:Phosphoglycerate mutase-like protein 1 [Bienertia sinuspersici]